MMICDNDDWRRLLGMEFYPLHELMADFLLTTLPAGLHFTWGNSRRMNDPDFKIIANAFVVISKMFRTIDQVETYLNSPGLNIVYYLQVGRGGAGLPNGDPIYFLSHKHYHPGTEGHDLALVRGRRGGRDTSTPRTERFPHVCPRCGSWAYVGACVVECSDEACR